MISSINIRWALLVVNFLIVGISGECQNDTNSGVGYAQIGEPCLIGGFERFIKNYKNASIIQARPAISTFNCLLCDPKRLLECHDKDKNASGTKEYQVSAGLTNAGPLGVCDCTSIHVNGYLLAYDENSKECRGVFTSVCDNKVLCYTGLNCHLGTCLCGMGGADNETCQNNIPKIKMPPHYVIVKSDGSTHAFVKHFTILIILVLWEAA